MQGKCQTSSLMNHLLETLGIVWFGVAQSGCAFENFESLIVRLIGQPDLVDFIVFLGLLGLVCLR